MNIHTDMLTLANSDLEQFNLFGDSFGVEEVFTPSTVESYSEPVRRLLETAVNPMAEENFNFYDNTTDKLSYNHPTHRESLDHQSIGSPTESTQSTDLLDLESFAYDSSWNAANDDKSDPDWMPTTISENSPRKCTTKHTSSYKASRTSNVCANPSTTKVTKRRNSSVTSELELQIEIEESTKRAKRCTAPLTEEQKKLRRKELNRLAAQRCRSKRKSHAELLEDEIDVLTKKNRELKERLEELESTKTELYDIIKFHFAKCHSQ